ncbi:MAG: DUF1127 domain-containing protein [Anaerolineaceae bacterium]
MFTLFEEWRTYNRTRNELMSLSQRELDDIGLTRYGIEQVSYKSAQRVAEEAGPSWISQIWTTIKAVFKQDPVHDYLSQSSDIADLERRLKNLPKHI